jgi:hypothetical protein
LVIPRTVETLNKSARTTIIRIRVVFRMVPPTDSY